MYKMYKILEVGKYYIFRKSTSLAETSTWNEIMKKVLDGKPRRCTYVHREYPSAIMFEGLELKSALSWFWGVDYIYFIEYVKYEPQSLET